MSIDYQIDNKRNYYHRDCETYDRDDDSNESIIGVPDLQEIMKNVSMQYNQEANARLNWREEYAGTREFRRIEGHIDQIKYSSKVSVSFTLVEKEFDHVDFVLLEEAVDKHFTEYRAIIDRKSGRVRLRTWGLNHNYESIVYVRSIHPVSSPPVAFKLTIHREDGTRYTVHSGRPELTVGLIQTILNNVDYDEAHDELRNMLPGSDISSSTSDL